MEKLNLKIDMILDHRAFAPAQSRSWPTCSGFRPRSCRTFADYLRSQGFLEIHTSKIVGTGTEGGTSLFSMEYFEQTAYLAQSPQFYKQMLVGASYERVFEIGFVYRAEDHATSRHINEYLSLDFEMGFIENEQDVIRVEVGIPQAVVRQPACELRRRTGVLQEGTARDQRHSAVPAGRGARNPEEGIRQDSWATRTTLTRKGRGCSASTRRRRATRSSSFVTMYPTSVRPFYAMPDKDNPDADPELRPAVQGAGSDDRRPAHSRPGDARSQHPVARHEPGELRRATLRSSGSACRRMAGWQSAPNA